MAAAPGTASQPLQPALPVFSTPSTIGPESVSDILSDAGDLLDPADVTLGANGHNIVKDTKVDGHATSASSSSPTSASDIATPSNNAALGHVSTSPPQGRYDNTVNEYDLIKEASRAKGIKSRTVCVAIPVNRKDGTVLMVTSRKHDTKWICRFLPVPPVPGPLADNLVSQSLKEVTKRARRMQKRQSGSLGKKVLVASS